MSKERIIESLEYCRKNQKSNDCQSCEYGGRSFQICERLVDDIIVLLKEQEAKKVIIDMYGNYCPWCSTKTSRAMGVQKLHLGTKFCPYCGKTVKWND